MITWKNIASAHISSEAKRGKKEKRQERKKERKKREREGGVNSLLSLGTEPFVVVETCVLLAACAVFKAWKDKRQAKR